MTAAVQLNLASGTCLPQMTAHFLKSTSIISLLLLIFFSIFPIQSKLLTDAIRTFSKAAEVLPSIDTVAWNASQTEDALLRWRKTAYQIQSDQLRKMADTLCRREEFWDCGISRTCPMSPCEVSTTKCGECPAMRMDTDFPGICASGVSVEEAHFSVSPQYRRFSGCRVSRIRFPRAEH